MSDDDYSTKRGIFNVSLCKFKLSKTGYLWRYSYYEDGKIKYLSSRNLVKLRKMVLGKGFDWIVTDNKNAIDSYKLNKELNKGEDVNDDMWFNNSSGVRYVYKHKDEGSARGFYWQYKNHYNEGQAQYSAKYLPVLKGKIDDLGFDWIIVNKELFDKVYSEELELMKEDSYI